MKNIPDFFIVGAPKCGTTSMTYYLSQHPEIFIHEGRELHFFGSDLKKDPEYFCSPEKYEAAFKNRNEELIVGEKSTLYLMSRLAAKEIKAFSPNARIIIMLRDPIDMLVSLHSHLYFGHVQDIANFREALEEGEKRRFPVSDNDEDIDPETIANTLDPRVYRDIVKFSRQVDRYFNIFGRENVHVILFDDLKKDLSAVYRDLTIFLGVSENFQPDFNILNSSRVLGSHGLWRLPRLLKKITSKIFSFKQRRRLNDLVIQNVLKKIVRGGSKEIIDAELRAELRDELAPEIDKLSKLLNRDLSDWNV